MEGFWYGALVITLALLLPVYFSGSLLALLRATGLQ